MSDTIYDGLPTLATEAFEGRIPEPSAKPITETDLLDPEAESALQDREDWESQDEPDFDGYLGDDAYATWPMRFGKDFGDEDAIFGRGL